MEFLKNALRHFLVVDFGHVRIKVKFGGCPLHCLICSRKIITAVWATVLTWAYGFITRNWVGLWMSKRNPSRAESLRDDSCSWMR